MKESVPFFSVCIPTYEMKGRGVEFLKFSLDILKRQTFQSFEVVISDHSVDDAIENLCGSMDMNIHHIKNSENLGSSSANINNAIKNARGEWIKCLFQDDFLREDTTLEAIKGFIDASDQNGWVVTGSEHTYDGQNIGNHHTPRWSLEAIQSGHNTISSPSVLCFKNTTPPSMFFDENLIWLMDIDIYHRLFLAYGEPKILEASHAVNRVWDGSVTSTVSEEQKQSEVAYFQKKLGI